MSTVHLSVFDRTLEKSNRWIADTMEALETDDPHTAYRALRAVLHALRDRLAVEAAAGLGAQMPMLIRGLYFEGWVPTGKPTRIRHRNLFLAQVGRELGVFEERENARVVEAVLRVLEAHLSQGEIDEVKHALPRELRTLWPAQATAWPPATLS
jgi:uncharacterized protein (DUF2267 family)